MSIYSENQPLHQVKTNRQLTVGVSSTSLTIPSNTEGGADVIFPLSGTAAASFSMTLTTAGAGTGTVTAAPAGYPVLNCVSGSNLNCTAFYEAGTLVSLIATPNDWKQPGTFSGACSGTGNCTTTMNANKTVTATFATAFKVRNSAGTTLDHPTIQDAYAAAASGATIRAQNYLFLESLLFNRPVPVTLSGGWNSTYAANTGGYATVTGSVTISSGSVVIDKLIIR